MKRLVIGLAVAGFLVFGHGFHHGPWHWGPGVVVCTEAGCHPAGPVEG